jgi:hypothetical protein
VRRAISLGVSALALTLAACGHSNAAAPPRTTTSSTTTTTTPVASVKVEKLTGGTTTPYVYDYTVEYPQLEGLPDQGMQRTINADLTRAASELVGDFVAGATNGPQASSTSSTSTSDPSQQSSLKATEETTLLDPRLASFRVQAISYFAGAAHPSTVDHTFSYDLSSGKRLSLLDLFRAGSGYLEWLSNESRRQLAASKDFSPDMARDGTTPTEEHFATFSLLPTALEIVFGEYQVGPYAIGIQRASFPYAQLRPLLASPGPLDGR